MGGFELLTATATGDVQTHTGTDEAPQHTTQPCVVFLHGILGSRSNWRGFARRVLAAHPRLCVLLIDLRNHGDAAAQPGPHTVDACVRDLHALERLLGRHPAAIVGHSYGGKVALRAGVHVPPPEQLRHVVSLDAPPGPRTFDASLAQAPASHDEIMRVLDAVRGVPLPVASRNALVDHLRAHGLSSGIAQWMTTNLKPVDGGFAWKFQLDAIPEMLASFAELDLWPALLAHRGQPQLHLVRAENGGRYTDREWDRANAGAAQGAFSAQMMPGVAHWLHTDDPEGLLRLLAPILLDVENA